QLGLNLNMEAELVERAIEEIGIGFMFAPNFHPAMKNVASVRREIGVRTVFNILGPLTNPAGANAQLIGVYDSELLEPMCLAAHQGQNDPRVQMVLANAAAGLVLCEKAENFREGVEIASKVVSDGKPFQKLYQLVEFSGGDTQRLKNLA